MGGRRIFAGVLTALALGCASAPAPKAERTVLVGTDTEAVVILPLNVTAVMPEELEPEAPVVWEELEVYLRAHGASLKTLAFPVSRRFWLESIVEAREGESGRRAGFDEAARIFVARVSKHADFDMLIVPSLFVRAATIDGRSVSWDGVERTLEIDVGAWGDRFPEKPVITGMAPAASLHAVVLDAQGGRIQEGRGGIALLVGALATGRPETSIDSPAYKFVRRSEPFADRAAVREGIALAFSPLLPPLVASEPDEETPRD